MIPDPVLQDFLSRHAASLDRVGETIAQWIAPGDEARLDQTAKVVRFIRNGALVFEARAELVGIYFLDVGVWRWWWMVERGRVTASPLDAVFIEGRRLGIGTLTDEHPAIESEEDAMQLARACAWLAGAEGIHEDNSGGKTTYYALFTSKPAGAGRNPALGQQAPKGPIPAAGPMMSMLPPPVAPVNSPIGDSGARSRTPVWNVAQRFDATVPKPPPPSDPGSRPPRASAPAAIAPPPPLPPPPQLPDSRAPISSLPDRPSSRDNRELREPARPLVAAVAGEAFAASSSALRDAFIKSLLLVDVQIRDERLRFCAQLVALTRNGDLEALDVTRPLMDAVSQLITDDARSGNARWKRMVIRIQPGDSGVTWSVTVK